MRTKRISTGFVMLLAAFGWLWAGSGANAQQLMAEYIGLGQPIFNEEDVETLQKEFQLSPEQRTAVEALLKDAMSRAYKVGMKVWEQSPWDVGALEREPLEDAEAEAAFQEKQMAEWHRRSVEAAREGAKMERQALAEVESLLTREQAAKGWGGFDRHRRRSLVQLGTYWFGCDPGAMLKTLNASEADRRAAAPLLERYDEQIDGLLVRRMAAIKRLNEKALAGEKIDGNIWMSGEMMPREIRRLNVRTFKEIGEVVSAELAEAIARQRAGSELWNFQSLEHDARFQQIRGVATLTPEQKTAMDALVAAGREELCAVVLETVRKQDEMVLRGEEPGVIEVKSMEGQQKFGSAKAKLLKELESLLTTEQRQAMNSGVAYQDMDQLFSRKRSLLQPSPWRSGQ